MTPASRWIVAVALTMGVVFGQKPNAPTQPFTVCEVLADVSQFADKAVVVGRLESSGSLIDYSEFLSQDECEHPIITHGHHWSTEILVWARWEAGMPKPPTEKVTSEPSILAAKLQSVRRTTELGSHREQYFRSDGHVLSYAGTATKLNEWAVIYGRIVRMPSLDKDCGAGGCGGDNVPLAIIAEPYNVHQLTGDGRLLTQQ